MKFLAIETSTIYTVVVAGNETRLLAHARLRLEKGRGDGLPELISDVLKKAKLKMEELDVFGVGAGPGSFTGLRVGLSMVKGLSYALNKPVAAFSSLDAIAFNRPSDVRRLAVAVDARRSNIYCRFYDGKTALRPATKAAMMPAGRFLGRLTPGMTVTGDALSAYKKDIVSGSVNVRVRPQAWWYPTPASVAACVRSCWTRKELTDSFGLQAIYFYDSACQVRIKKGPHGQV